MDLDVSGCGACQALNLANSSSNYVATYEPWVPIGPGACQLMGDSSDSLAISCGDGCTVSCFSNSFIADNKEERGQSRVICSVMPFT